MDLTANLDELFLYKQKLFELLCGDEKIVRLLLDREDVEVPNRDLPMKLVLPYNYVPEAATHGSTYICFDIEIPRVENNTYLDPAIYVWAFCHQSKMVVEGGGGTRPDQLALRINRVLLKSSAFGATPLQLASVSSVSPIKGFWGKLLQYRTVAFNSPSSQAGELRGPRRGSVP